MTDEPTLDPQPAEVPVAEALRRVMADLDAIGKAGRMTGPGGNYSFRQFDDIVDAVSPLACRHGVTFAPRVIAQERERLDRGGGKTSMWVALTVAWDVRGPAGDRLDPAPTTVGEALDTSDKAANKAHTAAMKVLLSQLLLIPFSSDEQDAERPDAGHPVGQTPRRGPQKPVRATKQAGKVEPLPDLTPDELAAMWRGASPDVQRAADDLQARLDGLPAELADRACEHMAKETGRTDVADVADLPPGCLGRWSYWLTKAENAREGS